MDSFLHELQSVFWWVGRTSIDASILACLVFIAQSVFRRQLNAKWNHILWLLVVIRLLMPFAPQCPASIFNIIRLEQPAEEKPRSLVAHVEPAAATEPGGQAQAASAGAETGGTSAPGPTMTYSFAWQRALAVVWAVVTLLFAGRILFGHYRLSARVCRRRPVTNQAILELLEDCKDLIGVHVPMSLVESPAVKTPALMGFIRPRLLLPPHVVEVFDREKLRDIFLHELAHLKRGDVVVNWVMSILQVIHWFNPLLWLSFNRIRADREIACDSYVLSLVRAGDNRHYGNTIINLLEHAARSDIIPGVVGIIEDKNEAKRRISMIAEFENNKYRWSFLAATLCLALGLVGLTSAESGNTPASATPADGVKSAAAAAPAPVDAAALPVAGKVVVALTPLSASDGYGAEQSAVSQVMQAELSQSANITLVDRDEMNKALGELKLSQQGMVPPESARQLGKIVGARYFCSGSISRSGEKIMAVAKVIEIETTLTKVTYAFLKNKDDAEESGKSLAGQVVKVITQFESERVVRDRESAAEAGKKIAKEIPADWKRPAVMVIIREMHVRQPALIDPAGETEITKRLLASNFRVIDSEYVNMMKTDQVAAKRTFGSLKTAAEYAGKKGVDVLLYGEAVSERAAALGDFEGCRGRIELKAIKVGKEEILLSDSAEGGATDLAETIAGKKAIQNAANRLADTFLYSLAEKWNSRK